jgi:hypothetical protein
MSNNKQQTAVEWLIEQLQNNVHHTIRIPLDIIQQAREMHKKEMSYDDGYAEGYNRAIELTKWAISNLIPPHNEQNNQSNQEHI